MAASGLAARQPSESQNIWRQAWRRFCRHKAGVLGLIVLTLEIVVAILAPVLIPRELAIDPRPLNILQRPSMAHWLGTDEVGRDIFARLVYGRLDVAHTPAGLPAAPLETLRPVFVGP